MDQLALAPGVPERGVVFHRIEAHGDDHVRLIEQAVGRLVVEQPDPSAETVEPVARDHARGLVGAGDGEPGAGEQRAHRLGDGSLARQHAEQHHRPFGGLDQGGGGGDRFGVGRAERRDGRGGEHGAGGGRFHDVLGQSEKGRARTARFGGAEGGGGRFGDRRRRIDLGGIFGDGAQQRHRVHALVRLLQPVGDRHGAAQRHDGITFGIGGGQTGCQVGDARTRGHEHDAGLAGQPAQPARDEGRVLLVPADDQLDLRVDERIEDGVDLGAGDAEYVFDALGLEVAHQQVCAVLRVAHSTSPRLEFGDDYARARKACRGCGGDGFEASPQR